MIFKEWLGTTNCCHCEKSCGNYLIDGKNIVGMQGVFCLQCSNTMQVRIGTGYGQLYKKTYNKWIKVSG